jgi:uncharacterized protein YjbI with pentapeptide repeats
MTNVAIAVSIIVFAALLVAIIYLPKWQAGTLEGGDDKLTAQRNFEVEKERFRMEDDARKTLAQIIGGVLVLLGLVVTYNTYRVGVQKQDLDRDSQVTDRFSKAITHLGDDKIAIRIGGLFELERIAKDSPRDASTTKQVIYAYLHDKFSNVQNLSPDSISPRPTAPETTNETNVPQQKSNGLAIAKFNTPIEVQTILNIIQNLLGESERLDLRHLDLSGKSLANGKYALANFQNTNISNSNLFASDFTSADFRSASLRGASTDISEHVELGKSIVGLVVPEKLRTIFSNATFFEADLSEADLSLGKFVGTKLRSCKLNKTILYKTDLTDADLFRAEANQLDLRQADLTRTNFANAQLRGAVFGSTKFQSTVFSGADLTDAVGISLEDLKNCIITEETRLPAPLEPYKSELLEFSKMNVKSDPEFLLSLPKLPGSNTAAKKQGVDPGAANRA